MTSLLVRGLAGFAVALALSMVALGQLDVALTLHEAATVPEAEMAPTVGTHRGQAGWGPWRTEVVEMWGGDSSNERVRVRVAPLPEGSRVGVHPDLLVTGERGSAAVRFADVPPAPRAWVPFGVSAAVLALAALAALAFAVRPFGEAVFGQRADGAKGFGWLPGHGSHGGSGGQVPPYVPFSEDWDPKDRTR